MKYPSISRSPPPELFPKVKAPARAHYHVVNVLLCSPRHWGEFSERSLGRVQYSRGRSSLLCPLWRPSIKLGRIKAASACFGQTISREPWVVAVAVAVVVDLLTWGSGPGLEFSVSSTTS